jgi:hypothetical protein
MKQSIILALCFLPLAIIYIIMKISVWAIGINSERTYVRNDAKRPHGPYVDNAYGDVDEEEEEYGSRTDYR